jgi:putative acetyltransferase
MVIKQVHPTDVQVGTLIEKLNQYQVGLYGVDACNLETAESLEKNKAYMLGAYVEEVLVGIGAVKLLEGYAEIKRMYVVESYRGLAIAESILHTLEAYVQQSGIDRIFLETGYLHHAAISFYKKLGYAQVESFGTYKPNQVSVYFGKTLHA